MKKLILILFIFIVSVPAFSQTIQLTDTTGRDMVGDTFFIDVIVDKDNAYQEVSNKHFINVINNTGDTMTIGLVREEVQIVNGSFDYLCWGSQCFGEKASGSTPLWDVNDSSIVAPGDTAGGIFGGLAIYFRPNIQIGVTVYRYKFYDRSNQFSTASFYVKYKATFPTGIEEQTIDAKEVAVFPNPASNFVSISLGNNYSTQNKTIEIRDLVGKLVRRANFPNGTNQLKLDVSSFDSGIYFVSILEGGQSLVSKKLIVK